MGEERRRVLELLATGQVTPAQADQLIDALDNPPVASWPSSQPAISHPVHASGATSRSGMRFSHQDLIRLADHGVDASFIRELRQFGITDLTLDQVITLANHGVDPEFIAAMRRLGLHELTYNQVIKLAEHGVDADYVKAMQDLGLADLSIDQIIDMANHGVDPEFMREIQAVQKEDSDTER